MWVSERSSTPRTTWASAQSGSAMTKPRSTCCRSACRSGVFRRTSGRRNVGVGRKACRRAWLPGKAGGKDKELHPGNGGLRRLRRPSRPTQDRILCIKKTTAEAAPSPWASSSHVPEIPRFHILDSWKNDIRGKFKKRLAEAVKSAEAGKF